MRLFGLEVSSGKPFTPAQCPQCGNEHVNRELRAWKVGGDGRQMLAVKSGETVRCAACAYRFTVTQDGKVLHMRRAERPVNAQPFLRERGARDGGGGGLDSDLEPLDIDLPQP